MLAGETDSPRTEQDSLAWEVFGNRALRQGDWKLRWQWKPFGTGEWELFDLAADPGERSDLAAEYPERVAALRQLWDTYVEENNVILPSRSVFEGMEDGLPTRFPDDAGYPPLIYKKQFVPPKDMLAGPGE
jgi:arylsulfatase